MVSFGSSGSGGSSSSQQGFRDLPEEIQNAFKTLATQSQEQLTGGNLSSMFTPTGQTAEETNAYNAINKGFSPTASSISSDIAMQTNPYDKYVIDEINRQSQGQNSALQQNMNAAGQFGSNRQFLGANDIDLSRLNQIGQFRQNQYNTSLNNALTTLPSARANDASAQLSAANAQRSLAAQTAQAPISGLAAISSILGVLPTNSGQSTSSNNSSGWNFGFGSDIRIKRDLKKIDTKNGYDLYEFRYLGSSKKNIGVIAQDVMEKNPDAVCKINGVLHVNYNMIGIPFKEAA